jgi:hypothetical protein
VHRHVPTPPDVSENEGLFDLPADNTGNANTSANTASLRLSLEEMKVTDAATLAASVNMMRSV